MYLGTEGASVIGVFCQRRLLSERAFVGEGFCQPTPMCNERKGKEGRIPTLSYFGKENKNI